MKKITVLLLAAALLLTMLPIFGSAAEKRKMGDVNNDGKVNYADSLAVLRHSIGDKKLDSVSLRYGEVNGKAPVNYADALKILRASINMDVLPPPPGNDNENDLPIF